MFESDMPEPVILEEYLRQSSTSLYVADRYGTGASISAAAVETLEGIERILCLVVEAVVASRYREGERPEESRPC